MVFAFSLFFLLLIFKDRWLKNRFRISRQAAYEWLGMKNLLTFQPIHLLYAIILEVNQIDGISQSYTADSDVLDHYHRFDLQEKT